MKLGTLKDGTRDGKLVVVSRDLTKVVAAQDIAPTLQRALDDWARAEPALRALAARLEKGNAPGAFAFEPAKMMAPLPRAYQWIDGSVFKNHGELMKKAFDTENKVSFPEDRPMMYQGASDEFIGPTDDFITAEEAWGIDFEAEVGVITGEVAMQTPPEKAGAAIRLVMLMNDWSLRNLIMEELSRMFGFMQSKPASACSPVAVTPDELGPAWKDWMVHLPLRVELNRAPFGRANAGVGAAFNFSHLISHATRTRNLVAGSIIGSGTVSNADRETGSSCIAERRAMERIEHGAPRTPFMKFGDRVRIEAVDAAGLSVFGVIDQKCSALARRV
jgi:fumarylacetoacetate (FAA) hydrolase